MIKSQNKVYTGAAPAHSRSCFNSAVTTAKAVTACALKYYRCRAYSALRP